MAIIIVNSQPTPWQTEPTPLFRETKLDQSSIKISSHLGDRPPVQNVKMSLKSYQDDPRYSDHSNFVIDYEILGDDFLQISSITKNEHITGVEKELTLNFYNSQQLTPGIYKASVNIYILALNGVNGAMDVVDHDTMEVEYEVDSMDLTLSETNLFVNHVKDSVPMWSGSVDVQCSGIWDMLNSDSENKSTVLVNGSDQQDWTFSGDQTLVFTMSPDVNELDLGYYLLKVQFYQPSLVAELNIHLVVLAGSGMLVSPKKFEFEAIRYLSEPEHQYAHVFASWITVSQVPAWLTVIQETFAYSFDYNRLKIKPIDSANLSPGVYNAMINVSSGGQSEWISIRHVVFGEWNVNYDKPVHFTKDNSLLQLFSQSIEDTYIRLEGQITIYDTKGESKNLNREWGIGFLNNRAEINLGRELDDYLNFELDPLKNISTKLEPCYKPLSIKLTAREVRYEDETTVALYTLPYQYFLRGRKPNYNKVFQNENQNNFWATHFAEDDFRVTAKSIVELNVFKDYGMPEPIIVKRNGEVISTINWSTNENYAQPIFMNKRFQFSSIQNLEPGEVIAFMYGGTQRNYIVLPQQNHSLHIGWITQFQTLELFEFTGEHSMPIEYDANVSEYFINWKRVFRKLESKKTQTISINTGWVFKSSIRLIDEIIDSKKAYLILKTNTLSSTAQETHIELVPISKKLSASDSKRSLYDFTVEFQINQKHEDSIYLR